MTQRAQRLGQITRQRTHVESLAAAHAQLDGVAVDRVHLALEQLHTAQRRLDDFTRTHALVQALAIDLDRAHRGRSLLQRTHERGAYLTHAFERQRRHWRLSRDVPRRVQAVCAASQLERRVVGFLAGRQQVHQLGRLAHHHDQDAAGHRVQRAGVAYGLGAEHSARHRHRVVRRGTRALVHDQQAVRLIRAWVHSA